MATTQKNNVAWLEGLYTAFNQGDVESVMDAMADDITWFEPEGEPHAGTYHSPEEVLQNVFAKIPEQVDSFAANPNQFIDGGEMLAVEGVYDVTSKAGEDFEIPYAHVWRLEDGKLQEFRDYSDTHVYREAFGF